MYICLGAGWTISVAKERYPKYDNAGDQFVIQLVCGLNPSSPEFAISTTYFKTINKPEEKDASDFFIGIFGYELISDSSLRMLVRMMLDTTAFHYGWLKSNMHENNPFLFSCLFSPLYFFDQDFNRNNTWNKTDKTLTLNVISPHVNILAILEAIWKSKDGMADKV